MYIFQWLWSQAWQTTAAPTSAGGAVSKTENEIYFRNVCANITLEIKLYFQLTSIIFPFKQVIYIYFRKRVHEKEKQRKKISCPA